MNEKKSSSWGGRRVGSGRKKKNQDVAQPRNQEAPTAATTGYDTSIQDENIGMENQSNEMDNLDMPTQNELKEIRQKNLDDKRKAIKMKKNQAVETVKPTQQVHTNQDEKPKKSFWSSIFDDGDED